MIRFSRMLAFLCFFLTLLLHLWPNAVAPLHAQGSRKDDIVFNSRGVPLAGATVRVCAMPATGQPCTPLALIYSDALLTQALANPTTTDGLGNYNFYAAPGKYMLEFSGPGITTRQVPNVILPSDPSTPSFSSLSSTGNISAFSLNLTGNLTVNGNTVVVGTLASGTLNLSNQSTAPGTPSSGTVNLYTKTTDKRIYYKDDTGAEIGPIASGSGAQTNVANTWTAAQNIDADFHTKGPNPSYDITRYGGYIGPNFYNGTSGFTTGTMSAGSSTLTLANAYDFANGHGVLILGAGPAPTISTPTGLTAAPMNVGGSSTRTYSVVAEDYFGGRTAASAPGTITTAVATPGIQTAALSSCNRSSGIVTCTTTAPHNFQNTAQVELQGGTTGDVTFEGVFTMTSVTSTTFSYTQYGVLDASGTVTHGNARAAGRVALKWNAPAASNTVLRNYIYVCTTTCALPANAANFSLIGVSMGNDSYFVDAGYGITVATIDNGDVSATPPSSASNQWLSTTISNGGGTTTLTLANPSTNAVSAVRVLHDNAPNIRNACTSFPNNGQSIGGTIYVPGALNSTYDFPIASTLNLSLCPGQTEIDFGAPTWLTGSIIPRAGSKLKGLAAGNLSQATPFYNLSTNGVLVGLAYPMIYMTSGISHDLSLESLTIIGNQSYQSLIYQDQVVTGDGVASIRYEDVHLAGGSATTSLVTKGGFGFYWIRGGWSNNPSDFSAPPSALFTTNCGTGQTNPILPYIVYTDHTYIFGGGLVIDSCGAALVGNGGNDNMEFRDAITEGSYVPIIRVNTGGYYLFSEIDLYHVSYADLRAGAATPLFDFTNTVISGLRAVAPSCATGAQPVFETSTSTTAYTGLEVYNAGYSCPYTGINYGVTRNGQLNSDIYSNYLVDFTKNSRVIFQMSVPVAPQSAVVSAGGSVPVGAHSYAVTASDFDGGETLLGPAISATTTTGNQNVTVTVPAAFPAGASGVNVYRDNRLINAGCSKPQTTVPSGTLLDTTSFDCGSISPGVNSAGISSMSPNGFSTTKMRVGGEALTSSPRSEQNIFLPGALTSTWTASSWTLDKPVTVTRVQVQAKTAPAGCTTNAIVRVTDGSTPINVTIAAAANDSGAVTQNYAAGAVLTISVQTAAAGCTTAPADANATIQYRMQ